MIHPSLYRSFLGLSQLVLLSIPTFVPALHELLHYHQHLHCTTNHSDVHLHADIYDCNLCDYLTTFTLLNSHTGVSLKAPSGEAIIANAKSATFISSQTGAYHLRGPPVQLCSLLS